MTDGEGYIQKNIPWAQIIPSASLQELFHPRDIFLYVSLAISHYLYNNQFKIPFVWLGPETLLHLKVMRLARLWLLRTNTSYNGFGGAIEILRFNNNTDRKCRIYERSVRGHKCFLAWKWTWSQLGTRTRNVFDTKCIYLNHECTQK